MSFVGCYDDSLKELSYDESMIILTSHIPKPDPLKTISPVSGGGEDRIQAIAMEVVDYTKRVVLFSDNYPDRWDGFQYLPFKKYHEVLDALGVVTGQIRRRYPLQGTETYLRTISDIAHETRVGNCLEMAAVAQQRASTQHNVKAELYKIENGDHVVCVLNRHNADESDDNKKFGDDAWFVDPWSSSSCSFPASQIKTHLKIFRGTFTTSSGVKRTIIDEFDEKVHKLIRVDGTK